MISVPYFRAVFNNTALLKKVVKMLTIFIAHFKTKMYKNFRRCEMSKSTIIAVAGKGGVGKTSLSATIVYYRQVPYRKVSR